MSEGWRKFLGDRLRRHDPARDSEGLAPEERARMRRSLIEAERERISGGADAARATAAGRAGRGPAASLLLARPILAGVVTGALLVVLGLLATRRLSRPSPVARGGESGRALISSGPAGPSGRSSDLTDASAPGVRQVQIETPGGTRVVWVLNPDFKL